MHQQGRPWARCQAIQVAERNDAVPGGFPSLSTGRSSGLRSPLNDQFQFDFWFLFSNISFAVYFSALVCPRFVEHVTILNFDLSQKGLLRHFGEEPRAIEGPGSAPRKGECVRLRPVLVGFLILYNLRVKD